jgi:hypothetical protein
MKSSDKQPGLRSIISWQYRPPFCSYFCCLNFAPAPDPSCVTLFSIPFSRSCHWRCQGSSRKRRMH